MTQVEAVTVPDSRRIDFVSKVNGNQYSVSVALPWVPPSEAGYRVLYVLDGYVYFASAADAIRATGLDVVVVGIGYPEAPKYVNGLLETHGLFQGVTGTAAKIHAYMVQRIFDLSLPMRPDQLEKYAIPGLPLKADQIGGLDDFLAMIESDVKPRIADIAPIDLKNQALFGHSLGGLAAVHALFTNPNAYRTFIAASPALWWGDHAVMVNEPAFSAAVNAGTTSPRVLITMGADEDCLKTIPPSITLTREELEARIREMRMVENARDLCTKLQTCRGSGAYVVADYAVFPEQGHTISPWPALGRAIDFAFMN
ncbi:Ferri-bacillibactin esterase BesA [Pandoraea horticolens]|uniref:Ferri-bacillibactin esterase BesA n=1 Tax=Pandoraea horticolens TaxID=2508298 RepID=A0A5E4VQB2_9BURK|nr:alpha/beta hydrolase-fold protein [Pandoraea horticolens]VVE14143.1 Ferri-bacillibactin esterase BesA [Pandoraea horticolens]